MLDVLYCVFYENEEIKCSHTYNRGVMYSNFMVYSVNKRFFLTTAKLAGGLPDLATTNGCKVDTSNIVERIG